MAEEKFQFKVDASKGGCTGLFWRTGPSDKTVSRDNSWPRNGTLITGSLPAQHPGWVKCDNGLWLPVVNHGHTAVHKLDK